MTPEAELRQKAFALMELRRRDFHRFLSNTMPQFVDGWLYADLCAQLRQFHDDVRSKKSPRLILSLPPRHLKSQTCSVRFPVWCLLQNPTWEVVVSSYGQELANKFSRHARSLIESDNYIKKMWPWAKLAQNQGAVQEWRLESDNKLGGTFKATSKGAGLTGSGADCFVAGTRVLCYGGWVSIEDVRQGMIALTYNHELKTTEWSRVVATRKKYAHEITTVTTTEGTRIYCTPDHRIYSGDSYVRASDLVPRGWVLTIDSFSEMRNLRSSVESKKIRSSEETKKWDNPSLLLNKMRINWVCKVLWEKMHSLRKSYNGQKQKVLQYLQATIEHEKIKRKNLSNVQLEVSTKALHKTLLLRRLCKPFALKKNERTRKSKSKTTKELQSIISKIKRTYHRTRQLFLCSLRFRKNTGSSSYRLEQTQQPSKQPDHSLSFMPHAFTQKPKENTIARIETNSVRKTAVYDIQLEKNHNFFAEGILVHNCLICDDLLRDAEEADSQTVREHLWDWYNSVAVTRLAPGGGILVIGTRWHEQDLTGRLLLEARRSAEVDQWQHIEYRAIAETDELHRKAGEILLPGRFTKEQMEKTRASMSPRWWEALYQQRPSAAGGNLFKEEHFKRFLSAPEDFDTLVQVWDLRFGKSKDSGSYVVGWVMGRKGSDFYIVDEERGRWSYAESRDAIRRLTARHPNAIAKLIENKANGPAIESDLEGEIPGIILYDPRGDKFQRAERILPLCIAGNVHLPDDHAAPWARDTLQEIITFPRAANDDRVDVLSMGLGYLFEQQNQFLTVISL